MITTEFLDLALRMPSHYSNRPVDEVGRFARLKAPALNKMELEPLAIGLVLLALLAGCLAWMAAVYFRLLAQVQ